MNEKEMKKSLHFNYDIKIYYLLGFFFRIY